MTTAYSNYDQGLRAVWVKLKVAQARIRKRLDLDGCRYCGRSMTGEANLCPSCLELYTKLAAKFGEADRPERPAPAERLDFTPVGAVAAEWKPFKESE